MQELVSHNGVNSQRSSSSCSSKDDIKKNDTAKYPKAATKSMAKPKAVLAKRPQLRAASRGR